MSFLKERIDAGFLEHGRFHTKTYGAIINDYHEGNITAGTARKLLEILLLITEEETEIELRRKFLH